MRMIDQAQMEVSRLRIVFGLVMVCLVFLATQLWEVQVLDADNYRTSLDHQSVRRVRMAATRGRILDRNGDILADTVPSFCIAAYVEELRQPGRRSNTVAYIDAMLDDVSKGLGLPKVIGPKEIETHIKKRPALPLIAWRDVSDDVVAHWMEGVSRDFPGIDVYVEPKRVYPHATLAAHTLGYIGRAHPEQNAEENFHFYYPEMEGQSGLERSMNDPLEGVSGGRLLRVNAAGIMHGVIGEKKPIPGMDVVLTLDLKIQKLVEEGLKDYIGACVVMDPRDGAVLAMASMPTFDPNFFAGERSKTGWDALRLNPDRPMINRTISSTYPPGSTYKPLVALTALQSHVIDSGTPLDCDGAFEMGTTVFHCWAREKGHGSLAMIKAFEQSCNPYFIQIGLRCGYEKIRAESARLGFGARTDIPLGAEVPGYLPPVTTPWRKGDTCNLSIGQGDLLVTPVQMAVFMSALANGGRVVTPRLIESAWKDETLRPPRNLRWPDEVLAIVRKGLFDVVQSETGTGKRARLDGVNMAGKTGTAEYGTRQNRKKYAWMIAYAPFEQPRFVIAVVLENAIAGGVNAAPLVKKVMTEALAIPVAGGLPPVVRGSGT